MRGAEGELLNELWPSPSFPPSLNEHTVSRCAYCWPWSADFYVSIGYSLVSNDGFKEQDPLNLAPSKLIELTVSCCTNCRPGLQIFYVSIGRSLVTYDLWPDLRPLVVGFSPLLSP